MFLVGLHGLYSLSSSPAISAVPQNTILCEIEEWHVKMQNVPLTLQVV